MIDRFNALILPLMMGVLLILSCQSKYNKPIKEQVLSGNVTIPEGFVLEELYKPQDHDQGSWVAITKDNQGKFYTSDQFGHLYRVTIPNEVNGLDSVLAEKLDLNIGLAQGLLWHNEILYAMVNSNVNRDLYIYSGFYKITDSSGDGEFDKVDTLRIFEGSFGEHGPHNIELSPDEKSLYLVLGNRIVIPDDLKSHVPKVWGEDNLLPIIFDPSGHASEIKAPGGWVAKTDLEGKDWTVLSVGMRNTYDIAFNQDGELFGFDSDMELDMGMPWYRPIRLCHITSGSEFGWRKGTGKFLPEYPDNLPGISNLGQGSPTGVLNGEGLKFPEYYQNGLYLYDWSYGTMYFARLRPKESSYDAEVSEFISGVPLPLTNGIVGDDGAMYFLTGGRKLESILYKLTYTGDRPSDIVKLQENTKGRKERDFRKELEVLHSKKSKDKIDFILDNLDHKDRYVRFAARVALENQNFDLWNNSINQVSSHRGVINFAIAVARVGYNEDRAKVMDVLLDREWKSLDESQKIDIIRAVELLLIRSQGELAGSYKEKIKNFFLPVYLKSSELINKEICKILSFLQVDDIIDPTLTKMEVDSVGSHHKSIYLSEDISKRSEQYGLKVQEMLENMPNPQSISYAKSLATIQEDWSKKSRERYFKWFNKALKKSGGNSYKQFIRAIQELALSNVPQADRQYFEALASEVMTESISMENVKQPRGPGKNWDIESVQSAYRNNLATANFENGRDYFKATLCANCHSINGVGGITGPELTQVGTRFSISDLAEAIINPSSTISDRYRFTEYHLEDGRVVIGKVIKDEEKDLEISTNAFTPDLTTKIKKKLIIKTEESMFSGMPPGLINRLSAQELTDLLAFLVSGGDKKNQIYQ